MINIKDKLYNMINWYNNINSNNQEINNESVKEKKEILINNQNENNIISNNILNEMTIIYDINK